MLPQRPRSHQLEDESRQAFKNKLPLEWVSEPIPPPEYGLDGRIEIFDKDGFTTGKMFFVQIKGTDEKELKKALAVQIEVTTCQYYQLLDLPVLIVLYNAYTSKIYVKWFHTYDPYYGRNAEKKITFRFSVEDEWQEKTPSRLVSELEAFRQLSSPQFTPPIKFIIKWQEEVIHNELSVKIELEINKISKKVSNFLEISSYIEENQAHGKITIDNNKIEIYIASGNGFTWHLPSKQKKNSKNKQTNTIDIFKLPNDIFLGIAVVLENAGHSNIAALIFTEIAANSSIITQPKIVMIAVNCMVRAHRLREALQLSERLSETEACHVATLLTIPASSQRFRLSESDNNYLHRFLENSIQRSAKLNDSRILATAHYNLGNYLGHRNLKLALHHYNQAIKCDSQYLQRSYFCRELAGILFESKKYSLSVKFYREALKLGEQGSCIALFADALMFAGKYAEALETFKAYLESTTEFEPEWGLKAFILGFIIQGFNCHEQKRNTSAALKLSAFDDNLSIMEYRNRLQESLIQDALCSNAWFNFGVLESENGSPDDALIPFLIAALTNLADVEAWCNAIGIGFNKEDYELASYMIITAYKINDNNFIEQVIKFAQSQGTGFPLTDFVNIVHKVINEIPQQDNSFKLRLLGEGSDFDTFQF
ncbi:MAG TPA: DUF4365 domain-containing protein [Nostocaceae cyanobacterium]|nr:DUF4365 domain-containing protein [Nostocaceae cyanobacterium]